MVKKGLIVFIVLAAFAAGGCTLFVRTGTVEGTVINATTGSGLSGVTVTVEGHAAFSTETDSDGAFTLDVPVGDQTLIFELTGYVFNPVPVTVADGEITYVSDGVIMASPSLSTGQYRFVLTWGTEPYDLDSHLLTPNGYHIYYSNPTPTGAGAYLDVDDTSSYGPETITIQTEEAGTYLYYVHNYSGYPDITTSGAEVRIYNSTGLMRTLSVPTTGTGEYWEVATLSGSTLTTVNTIVSVEPTN